MAALESLSFAWPAAALALPLPWLLRRLWPPAAGPALRVPDLAAFTARLPSSAATGEGSAVVIAPSLTRMPRLSTVLAALAWLALVLAAMRPQLVDPAQLAPASGRELMIALDVSASMGTPDMRLNDRAVSRLEAARALAAEFVGRRDGDRIGLIVFGSQAYLHTPLTFDLVAVQEALAGVEVGLAGRETTLGDALALAARRLAEYDESQRVLILLTDGAHNAGALSPEQALWLAQREDLRLFTVGIGARSLRVVAPEGIREVDPSAGLDEDTLQMLAERSGGLYWRATDVASLAAFYRQIDGLEPVAAESGLRFARELYVWPLAIALLIALSRFGPLLIRRDA
jgi:Ca-activated chloride channel family protein